MNIVRQRSAICLPDVVDSPHILRCCALLYDKLYILSPVPDRKSHEEEIDEICEKLQQLDKDYIVDLIARHVPLWVAMTTAQPGAILPLILTTFILHGIRTYSYLTNNDYRRLEKRMGDLYESQRLLPDTTSLANIGVLHDLHNDVTVEMAQLRVEESHIVGVSRDFSLQEIVREYYSYAPGRLNREVIPAQMIGTLLEHIKLLLLAEQQGALIVTPNSGSRRIMQLILKSLLSYEFGVSVDTVVKFEKVGNNDYILDHLLSLNLPDLSKSKMDDVLRLRDHASSTSLRRVLGKYSILPRGDQPSLVDEIRARMREVETRIRRLRQ